MFASLVLSNPAVDVAHAANRNAAQQARKRGAKFGSGHRLARHLCAGMPDNTRDRHSQRKPWTRPITEFVSQTDRRRFQRSGYGKADLYFG
jgi:hypothetical protein